MNNLYLNRLSMPITTGTPQQQKPQAAQTEAGGRSFLEVLQESLAQNSSGVAFSKHAVSRVVERNIELSDSSLLRLSEGVRIAQEKGLNDTLILVDRTAFIVNAKAGKVITTVDPDNLKGNVFTNIDGTVII